MTPSEQRLMALWTKQGLMSEGIGPEAEWSPVKPVMHQERHTAFWDAVSGMMPDDEDDEPYWMTFNATDDLKSNI